MLGLECQVETNCITFRSRHIEIVNTLSIGSTKQVGFGIDTIIRSAQPQIGSCNIYIKTLDKGFLEHFCKGIRERNRSQADPIRFFNILGSRAVKSASKTGIIPILSAD